MITALGIAKAGAVYLPVDPTYPEDRLTHILTDALGAGGSAPVSSVSAL